MGTRSSDSRQRSVIRELGDRGRRDWNEGLESLTCHFAPIRNRPAHDLRAVGTVIEAVEQQGKSFAFVVNAAIPRTHIALDALRALAQHGKVAPVTLHNRVDFATSMVGGRTAGELNGKSRSSGEVTELWAYAYTQLRKSTKR